MIRRLASRFGRDRKQDGQVNGGSPETNGINGNQKSLTATSKPKEVEDHSATRVEVECTFAKYAQLIHASNRPLPTQYVFLTLWSSLMCNGSLCHEVTRKSKFGKLSYSLASVEKEKADSDRSGDGSCVEHSEPSGLMQDIRSIVSQPRAICAIRVNLILLRVSK